ncbi:MAG: RDD family protein [Acidimicrobiales bacterium]
MDPTSVMGKRIVAYLIDAVTGVIVSVVGFLALAQTIEAEVDPCGLEGSPALCFYAGDTVYFADDGRASAVLLIGIGWWLAMGWLVQGVTGGTPGKLIMGLRVIDGRSGRLAGLGKCLGRTLMWVVDAQPFGFPLVGFITGLSSKGHRRVGDMAANTLVVAKRSVGTPPHVPGLTPGSSASSPPPATSPGDGVTGPMWDTARNAYIQWDPVLEQWMEFDDAAHEWIPISQ